MANKVLDYEARIKNLQEIEEKLKSLSVDISVKGASQITKSFQSLSDSSIKLASNLKRLEAQFISTGAAKDKFITNLKQLESVFTSLSQSLKGIKVSGNVQASSSGNTTTSASAWTLRKYMEQGQKKLEQSFSNYRRDRRPNVGNAFQDQEYRHNTGNLGYSSLGFQRSPKGQAYENQLYKINNNARSNLEKQAIADAKYYARIFNDNVKAEKVRAAQEREGYIFGKPYDYINRQPLGPPSPFIPHISSPSLYRKPIGPNQPPPPPPPPPLPPPPYSRIYPGLSANAQNYFTKTNQANQTQAQTGGLTPFQIRSGRLDQRIEEAKSKVQDLVGEQVLDKIFGGSRFDKARQGIASNAGISQSLLPTKSKFFDPSRLTKGSNPSSLLLTTLLGGFQEGAAGAVGGSVFGAPGILAGAVAAKAFGEAIGGVTEHLKAASEAAFELDRSALAISATLGINTVRKRNGQRIGDAEASELNDKEADRLITAARKTLLPLGLSTEFASTTTRALTQGFSGTQGFSDEFIAKVAPRIGAFTALADKTLLDQPTRYAKDISDILNKSPNARSTQLGSFISRNAPEIFTARTAEEFDKATRALDKYVEKLKDSNDALVQRLQIEGRFKNVQIEVGKSYNEASNSGLRAFNRNIKGVDLESGAQTVGAIGGGIAAIGLGVIAEAINLVGKVSNTTSDAFKGLVSWLKQINEYIFKLTGGHFGVNPKSLVPKPVKKDDTTSEAAPLKNLNSILNSLGLGEGKLGQSNLDYTSKLPQFQLYQIKQIQNQAASNKEFNDLLTPTDKTSLLRLKAEGQEKLDKIKIDSNFNSFFHDDKIASARAERASAETGLKDRRNVLQEAQFAQSEFLKVNKKGKLSPEETSEGNRLQATVEQAQQDYNKALVRTQHAQEAETAAIEDRTKSERQIRNANENLQEVLFKEVRSRKDLNQQIELNAKKLREFNETGKEAANRGAESEILSQAQRVKDLGGHTQFDYILNNKALKKQYELTEASAQLNDTLNKHGLQGDNNEVATHLIPDNGTGSFQLELQHQEEGFKDAIDSADHELDLLAKAVRDAREAMDELNKVARSLKKSPNKIGGPGTGSVNQGNNPTDPGLSTNSPPGYTPPGVVNPGNNPSKIPPAWPKKPGIPGSIDGKSIPPLTGPGTIDGKPIPPLFPGTGQMDGVPFSSPQEGGASWREYMKRWRSSSPDDVMSKTPPTNPAGAWAQKYNNGLIKMPPLIDKGHRISDGRGGYINSQGEYTKEPLKGGIFNSLHPKSGKLVDPPFYTPGGPSKFAIPPAPLDFVSKPEGLKAIAGLLPGLKPANLLQGHAERKFDRDIVKRGSRNASDIAWGSPNAKRLNTGRYPAEIIKYAQEAERATGVPVEVSLAQWGLESGYGKHTPDATNNPFGMQLGKKTSMPHTTFIKADLGSSPDSTMPHFEYANFRKFESTEDAFIKHGKDLMNPKGPYKGSIKYKDNLPEYVRRMGKVYAKDPEYSKKLLSIIKRDKLSQLAAPKSALLPPLNDLAHLRKDDYGDMRSEASGGLMLDAAAYGQHLKHLPSQSSLQAGQIEGILSKAKLNYKDGMEEDAREDNIWGMRPNYSKDFFKSEAHKVKNSIDSNKAVAKPHKDKISKADIQEAMQTAMQMALNSHFA